MQARVIFGEASSIINVKKKLSLPPFCPSCSERIPREAEVCPYCNWDPSQPVEPRQAVAPRRRIKQPKVIERTTVRVLNDESIPVSTTKEEPLHVVVTDFEMPFTSMVFFMVKWAIAAIPAAIILALLWAITSALFLG